MVAVVDFKKRVILNIVVLGAIVLVFGGLLYGASLHLSSQIDGIIKKRNLNTQYFYESEHLWQLRKEAVDAAVYERQMTLLLPEKDQMIYFPDWFRSMAKPYSVEVNYSFLADSGPTPDTPGNITFSISVRGNYSNVLVFLKSIESDQERFIVSLDTMDFRTLAFNDCQVTSKGKAFYK